MKPPNDAGYPGQRLSKQSSLIAKCTAPFASKQRTLVEHEIRLDQPFRSYSTSERVRGAVYLNLLKPIRITHLVIRLHGFVKVINRTKLPGETISYDETVLTLAKGRGRRGIEYFGNGFARLFEDEVLLCGEGRVVGPYKFDFDIALPSRHTPSSIDVSAT